MMLPGEDLEHVVKHVRSWQKLRNKRIFLTGSSGFVGTWLNKSFELADSELHLGAELVAVRREFAPPGEFDYGIHAARADDLQMDLELTARTVRLAEERGAQRLLYTSSGAIYGKSESGTSPAQEDCPANPQTQYAKAKYAGEQLFLSSRVGTAIARMFTFSGPKLPLDLNFAVGNFIRDALAGGRIVIEGDGTSVRSYLYAADMAAWLWTVMLDGEPGHVYNVGSSQPTTIRELAETVRQHSRHQVRIEVRGVGSTDHYVPNTNRARHELELHQLVPLGEGIRRMYRWHADSKIGEIAPAAATTP